MKHKKVLFSIVLAIAVALLWHLQSTDNAILKGNRTFSDDLVLTSEVISPGNSPGVIVVAGNFTMQSGATYVCELKDMTGAGNGHDQIDVSGNVALDGTLDIVFDGYTANDADHFDILKFGGTLTGTFSSISGLPTDWEVDYGTITPNTVTLYGPGAALPLELIGFDAKRKGKTVSLTWKTTSESNSDYFELEHSEDAKNFSVIDRVKSRTVTTGINTYTYEHKNPRQGISYYRLRQVDVDGTSRLSRIVYVDMGKQDIGFYPNPVKNGIIKFNQPVEAVTIYNTTGKAILRKENVESNLDVSGINKGVYLMEINNGSYTQKLIIE